MPELPEVETIRQDLEERICQKEIVKIDVFQPKLVKNSLPEFKKVLLNNSFLRIERRGKLLIFVLDKKQHFLLIHFKMTGQLVYRNGEKIISGGHNFPQINKTIDLPNKFTHLIFYFKDWGQLFYNDLRQFGYLKIVDLAEKEQIVNKFGIEPLMVNFTYQNFENIFVGRRTILKALLLNQQVIAGLGNIYVDEVCFEAGVLPNRPVNLLTQSEKKKLFLACEKILKKAIKARGTTFSDYRDANGQKGNFMEQLKVYGRSGQKCFVCNSEIQKIKLAWRGTHFCQICQK